MLEFNPFLRPTASELLANPEFNDIRNSSNEVKAKDKLRLLTDNDDAYDTSTSSFKLTKDELKKAIYSIV